MKSHNAQMLEGSHIQEPFAYLFSSPPALSSPRLRQITESHSGKRESRKRKQDVDHYQQYTETSRPHVSRHLAETKKPNNHSHYDPSHSEPNYRRLLPRIETPKQMGSVPQSGYFGVSRTDQPLSVNQNLNPDVESLNYHEPMMSGALSTTPKSSPVIPRGTPLQSNYRSRNISHPQPWKSTSPLNPPYPPVPFPSSPNLSIHVSKKQSAGPSRMYYQENLTNNGIASSIPPVTQMKTPRLRNGNFANQFFPLYTPIKSRQLSQRAPLRVETQFEAVQNPNPTLNSLSFLRNPYSIENMPIETSNQYHGGSGQYLDRPSTQHSLNCSLTSYNRHFTPTLRFSDSDPPSSIREYAGLSKKTTAGVQKMIGHENTPRKSTVDRNRTPKSQAGPLRGPSRSSIGVYQSRRRVVR
jgi:hypothetical protein